MFAPTRQDGISDFAVRVLSDGLGRSVSADEVFAYVYGLLHHSGYREEFAANLRKDAPRLPLSGDVEPILSVGQKLLDLHLGYEFVQSHKFAGTELPADVLVHSLAYPRKDGKRDWSRLVVNNSLVIEEIPEDAYKYRVGSKSPLEWVVSSASSRGQDGGPLAQDPNDWGSAMGNAGYLLSLVGKSVTLAQESVRLCRDLAELRPR